MPYCKDVCEKVAESNIVKNKFSKTFLRESGSLVRYVRLNFQQDMVVSLRVQVQLAKKR